MEFFIYFSVFVVQDSKKGGCPHPQSIDTVQFRFGGRYGPAANSLRTPVLDVRILIVLDCDCV